MVAMTLIRPLFEQHHCHVARYSDDEIAEYEPILRGCAVGEVRPVPERAPNQLGSIVALLPDSGMAFVLVQHLDPTHESLTAELLGKITAMKVEQAKT